MGDQRSVNAQPAGHGSKGMLGGFGGLSREHRRRPQLRVSWVVEAGANSRPGLGSGMEQR